jgi:hypothetical protein
LDLLSQPATQHFGEASTRALFLTLTYTSQPIDKCSTIYIEDVASASRPRKSYSWSTTHAPLNDFLKTISTKTVANLPASLVPDDKDIIITATSIDFLGTTSLPALFRLRLNSLPAPKVNAHTPCVFAYLHSTSHRMLMLLCMTCMDVASFC